MFSDDTKKLQQITVFFVLTVCFYGLSSSIARGTIDATTVGCTPSSLIQDEEYLLACCRYVELNPLRAAIVDDPADYRWSSCPAKVGRTTQAWLDLSPFYLNMGHSEAERAENYAAWLKETVPEQ